MVTYRFIFGTLSRGLVERELMSVESDVGLWSRVKRKGRGGARGGDGGGAGEAGGLKDE